MKTIILAVLIFFTPIFMIGTIGAFEANNIGFGQCILQAIIAIAVEYFSIKAFGKNA